MSLLKEHSAFPFEVGENNGYSPDGGMSIRAYFAAKAMQGLCVNQGRNEFTVNDVSELASASVAIADALIEALNQK